MSARMEGEVTSWKELQPESSEVARTFSETELKCLLRNSDGYELVAPLRQLREQPLDSQRGSQEEYRLALALQEQWEQWLVRRELLRNDIKRGKECLQQVQNELSSLRSKLEEWPAFERICGKNPLLDYMHSMAARERIAHFLPDWLKRREQELQAVTRKMEHCAREHGLEHML